MSANEQDERVVGAVFYKNLHGWPMVGGLPAHLLLAFIPVVAVSTFVLAQVFGGRLWQGLLVLGGWGAVYAGTVYMFSIDRGEIGAWIVSSRGKVLPTIDSFGPSFSSVIIVKDDE
jgi:hypothetical protein